MIGALTGRIVAEEIDGNVLIDVGGVGYEVTTPIGTLGKVRPADGDVVTLYTHTHVREDALDLYGFASRRERQVFRLLIGVPNVGPGLALRILSVMTVADLAEAVTAGDVARLSRVKGIGARTAQRLALELRDRLVAAAEGSNPEPQTGGTAPSRSNAQRLRGALTNMGYRQSEADRALKSLGSRLESEPVADLLREALSLLTR